MHRAGFLPLLFLAACSFDPSGVGPGREDAGLPDRAGDPASHEPLADDLASDAAPDGADDEPRPEAGDAPPADAPDPPDLPDLPDAPLPLDLPPDRSDDRGACSGRFPPHNFDGWGGRPIGGAWEVTADRLLGVIHSDPLDFLSPDGPGAEGTRQYALLRMEFAPLGAAGAATMTLRAGVDMTGCEDALLVFHTIVFNQIEEETFLVEVRSDAVEWTAPVTVYPTAASFPRNGCSIGSQAPPPCTAWERHEVRLGDVYGLAGPGFRVRVRTSQQIGFIEWPNHGVGFDELHVE